MSDGDRYDSVEVREAPASPTRTPPRDVKGDPALLAQGWVARFVADERQTKEAEELYTSLGFQFLAEAIAPEALGPRCGSCKDLVCGTYQMIYTRREAAVPPEGR